MEYTTVWIWLGIAINFNLVLGTNYRYTGEEGKHMPRKHTDAHTSEDQFVDSLPESQEWSHENALHVDTSGDVDTPRTYSRYKREVAKISDQLTDDNGLEGTQKKKSSVYNRDANQVTSSDGVRNPDLRRLETRISRLERQMSSQGHTLAGHWERLAAQHNLLLKQAEAGEDRMARLTTLGSKLDTQRAKLERVIMDNHWQDVKLRVMDNNSIALRHGIRQMDINIQSMYAEHGHFYKEIESLVDQLHESKLALKKAESRTNLLENSLRHLIYLRMEPSANSTVTEDNVKWLNNPAPNAHQGGGGGDSGLRGMNNMVLGQDSYLIYALKDMNKTMGKLVSSSSIQQRQIDEMSLDLEQLKDEVFTFYKYLEATQDRIRDLQPDASNVTLRKGALAMSENTMRFLMGKVEELQKEVGNLRFEFRKSNTMDMRTLERQRPVGTTTTPSVMFEATHDVPSVNEKSKVMTSTKPPHMYTEKPKSTENINFEYLSSSKNDLSTSKDYNHAPSTSTETNRHDMLEEQLKETMYKPKTGNEIDVISSSDEVSSGLLLKGESQQLAKNLKGENRKGYKSETKGKSKSGHKPRHLQNDTMDNRKQPPKNMKDMREKQKAKAKGSKSSGGKSGSGWSAEMLEVHPNDEDVCAMKGLEIGSPRTVARMAKALTGSWMRDSRARDDHIYVLKGNLKVNNMRLYQNEALLAAGNYTSVYAMPFRCTGTGHVVYNGSLYCNKYMSNRLMRYDIATQEVVSRRLRKAAYNNTYPYSCGAYTDMDFAVDEVGLWLIYSQSGDIVIAKVHPSTLEIQQEWTTQFPKEQALNSFMICGRLYVVSTDADITGVVYIYDTREAAGKMVPRGLIPVHKTADYMTMLDYNPKDAKLYAWQMSKDWIGEMVIYDVYFKDSLY